MSLPYTSLNLSISLYYLLDNRLHEFIKGLKEVSEFEQKTSFVLTFCVLSMKVIVASIRITGAVF
jgi:hypothetical protein